MSIVDGARPIARVALGSGVPWLSTLSVRSNEQFIENPVVELTTLLSAVVPHLKDKDGRPFASVARPSMGSCVNCEVTLATGAEMRGCVDGVVVVVELLVEVDSAEVTLLLEEDSEFWLVVVVLAVRLVVSLLELLVLVPVAVASVVDAPVLVVLPSELLRAVLNIASAVPLFWSVCAAVGALIVMLL